MRRRTFILSAAGVGVGAIAAGAVWHRSRRHRFALIGAGGRGRSLLDIFRRCVDIAAVCDVNTARFSEVRRLGFDGDFHQDFREVLSRDDIDGVLVATPDHWHADVSIEAMQAGKDVYCEKPMTVTVAEGQRLKQAVRETGRAFQVGTQQRSDPAFQTACAFARDGALGDLRNVTVDLPPVTWKYPGPFTPRPVPTGLDWKMWLGPAPWAEYCPERCDYNFRWWYDYSGGRLLGWGAHHVDVAMFGMPDTSKPIRISGTGECVDRKNTYDTPRVFRVKYEFDDGRTLQVNCGEKLELGSHPGILFEGADSSLYISRHEARGDLADRLPDPLSHEERCTRHLNNLLESMATHADPTSDVETQHRSVTMCHIGNIALRLGRDVVWDPVQEEFQNDSEANSLLSREPRLDVTS